MPSLVGSEMCIRDSVDGSINTTSALDNTASTQESEELSFHTPMVTLGAIHVDPSETWPPQHPTTVQRLDNNAPWPLRTSTPTLGQEHETGYESARQHMFSLTTPVGMQTLNTTHPLPANVPVTTIPRVPRTTAVELHNSNAAAVPHNNNTCLLYTSPSPRD